ncbi:MAG TPA: UDP-N-acetylmuramoyl-L-alanine--D-glutamate ligase [Actinomycetota bacterium]|nr:UDP-N-acetylmuramoyl-L-alanine--D-glutamate ligase [Actinomycetota bacterium]
MNLSGRRVVVVGLAESGLAAVETLLALNASVIVTEDRPRDAVTDAAARVEALGVVVHAGGHAESHLDDADLVVASPGVPEHAPILRWASRRGLEIWSELELGARLVRVPTVVVTGTNGKTTTTEMIATAMQRAGMNALACGNVGYPLSRAAREDHDALVIEASSFQLRFERSLHPRVSVLLNLAPDHLDWHGSLASYRDAKARIHAGQGARDVHIGNRDDAAAAAVSRAAPCPVAWFTLDSPEPGQAGYVDGRLVVRTAGDHDLGVPAAGGPAHNANAAAAALAAVSFGVAPNAVGAALQEYRPGPHRGTVIAEIDGVRYVDDSKATNPHAALASIAAHGSVVLIAGGLAKGVDLTPLAAAAPQLTGVVAIGEAAPQIVSIFDGLVPIRRAETIDEAVAEAAGLAAPGGTVLLAPACASMDMFRDYRERGDRFAQAVRAHAGRGAHA